MYCPFLLFSKKRYAGLLHPGGGAAGRVDVRGVETVRRDSCAFVQEVARARALEANICIPMCEAGI